MVRDTTERGRDLDQVLTQYMTFVKPAFEEFCSPVSYILNCNNMNLENNKHLRGLKLILRLKLISCFKQEVFTYKLS